MDVTMFVAALVVGGLSLFPAWIIFQLAQGAVRAVRGTALHILSALPSTNSIELANLVHRVSSPRNSRRILAFLWVLHAVGYIHIHEERSPAFGRACGPQVCLTTLGHEYLVNKQVN